MYVPSTGAFLASWVRRLRAGSSRSEPPRDAGASPGLRRRLITR
jgi:hypothetical protein